MAHSNDIRTHRPIMQTWLKPREKIFSTAKTIFLSRSSHSHLTAKMKNRRGQYTPSGSHIKEDQGLASSIKLRGVSVARRKRVNPPDVTTSLRRASPAWVPRAVPTSWLSEAGVHTVVEKP